MSARCRCKVVELPNVAAVLANPQQPLALDCIGSIHTIGSERNQSAPIDLATGTLGELASDRLTRCVVRWRQHPVTGSVVAGRTLSGWPAIRALAEAAHGAFAHRTLVGWDVAWTPVGPMLLEGNNSLDVMFPQRVYRQGFGRGPLGPLLQHHLEALARARHVD